MISFYKIQTKIKKTHLIMLENYKLNHNNIDIKIKKKNKNIIKHTKIRQKIHQLAPLNHGHVF